MTGQEGTPSFESMPGAQRVNDLLIVREIDFRIQCGVGWKTGNRCVLAATTTLRCLSCRRVLSTMFCDPHAHAVLSLTDPKEGHEGCKGSPAELLEASGLEESGWFTWAP